MKRVMWACLCRGISCGVYQETAPSVLEQEVCIVHRSNSQRCQGWASVRLYFPGPAKRRTGLRQLGLGHRPYTRSGIFRPTPLNPEDNTPKAKVVQQRVDYMSELGNAIKELTEAMRPPQRSINNNMRDIISSISRICAKTLEEHTEMKDTRRNVLLKTTTTKTTPGCKSFGWFYTINTPRKRNKTTHEEAPGNEIVNRSKKTEVNKMDKCREVVEKEEG